MADGTAIPSPRLERLVEHCTREKIPFIIGSYANAHHTLWGSTNVNERGNDLLEWLIGTNLTPINHGHQPTFVTRSRREILDVTLVTVGFLDRVEG